MSKVIYACYRNKKVSPEIKDKIVSICDELNPDNISPKQSLIHNSSEIIYGISNPNAGVEVREDNLLLGKIFGKTIDWSKVEADAPDGNFAIFRTQGKILEVLTDCMGTRTIWYYFDEEIFVASSSQKAIIRLIGNFQFDEKIIPWMISTGSLGPEAAWDKRLERIPLDGKITLDKLKWKITVSKNPIIFNAEKKSRSYHKKNLTEAIQKTFQDLKLNLNQWVVTLSGGHDSRAVLLLLNKYTRNNPGETLKTVTWGMKNSIETKGSDAYIARLLAENEKTDHSYFLTENANEPMEKIINRFLLNGEGRIDHITGYLDGFFIWQKMYQNPIEGVVRGDEVFGYYKAISTLMVKQVVGMLLCSDFSNLKKYKYINELKQQIPSDLQKLPTETLATWRDRLYHTYRAPVILAALSDLKYPYLEQINPFLSKKIVKAIRKMPDNLRTEKRTFKNIMKELDPGIPFAKSTSNESLTEVLKREDLVEIMVKELSSEYARKIFPEEFLKQLIQNIQVITPEKKAPKQSIIERIKKFIPKNLKKQLSKRNRYVKMDENLLALRIFIVCKMHRILSA